MSDKETEEKAQALIDILKKKGLTLALAESCTAGLASSLIAQIPGASKVLWGGFVCYTQEAKVSMLNIDNNLLTRHGLVSAEAAKAMAIGALSKSGAAIAASVTGLAGPEGDGSSVAVGTVWTAVAAKEKEPVAKEFFFKGSRNKIRLEASIGLLSELLSELLTE